MREIDVTRYSVPVQAQDGTMRELPYDVKHSLTAVMFSQGLKAMETLRRHQIAERIRKAEGAVLLEEADYAVVKAAVEAFEGWREQDVVLLERVLNAPQVEVGKVKE